MSQVDFYLLQSQQPNNARYFFTCRLIEKAYQRGHKIYVHTSSEQEAHRIDEMLWTFRDDSFIPHNLTGEGPSNPPVVQIGFNARPTAFNDVLINLTDQIPEWHHCFKRIIEIIPDEQQWRQNAREHYRFYRGKNFVLKSHEITP